MNNQVIFFMGYPGSGKGTQGKIISEKLNMVHLSTGELFRNEAKKRSPLGIQMESYMNIGQIIPKELTFSYLEKELSGGKYRKGIIIDGYPKDKESLDFIMKTLNTLHYNILCTFYFYIPRSGVFERLMNRKSRSDDTEITINKRLDVFEQDTIPVSKILNVTIIDAILPINVLSENIINILSDISTVFHNHIDAENKETLLGIVEKIGFNNKIYPVSDLTLGRQLKNPEYSDVYNSLQNFHEIENSKDEAFSTGKMGNTVNYGQIEKTLEVCLSSQGEIMTEVEEDIYSKKNNVVVLDRGNTPFKINWDKLPGWKDKMIKNVPKFELHHSIDISKLENETILPIDMEKLNKSLETDFEIGGLFVFEKNDRWAYRTNQFSNDNYDNSLHLLNEQSEKLIVLVSSFISNRKFETSCSLEKVHAIWKFPRPVTFVSGNKGKIADLNSILGYKLENADLKEIVEIQHSDVEKVAIQKCKDAYDILNIPVLVEDTSLQINCLKGCPGPFVKYFDPYIIYKMVQNFDDHSAIGECVFALKTKDKVITFKGAIKGKIVAPRGNNGFGWDRIFVPDNSDKTYAEMTQEEKNSFSMRKDPILKLFNK
jgi:non-canonical purine NTP pyrophosphatase (RdgB/HAM1 family)